MILLTVQLVVLFILYECATYIQKQTTENSAKENY